MTLTNKEKQDARKTMLTAAAIRDGWTKYSTALTDWLHGRARLVRVAEDPGRVSAAQEDGAR